MDIFAERTGMRNGIKRVRVGCGVYFLPNCDMLIAFSYDSDAGFLLNLLVLPPLRPIFFLLNSRYFSLFDSQIRHIEPFIVHLPRRWIGPVVQEPQDQIASIADQLPGFPFYQTMFATSQQI